MSAKKIFYGVFIGVLTLAAWELIRDKLFNKGNDQ
mgnify:CR=1 FL=1|tara:strand:- start:473 stop:577 length:105 start_codon:yes stop_codon:yes gene_type:complete